MGEVRFATSSVNIFLASLKVSSCSLLFVFLLSFLPFPFLCRDRRLGWSLPLAARRFSSYYFLLRAFPSFSSCLSLLSLLL